MPFLAPTTFSITVGLTPTAFAKARLLPPNNTSIIVSNLSFIVIIIKILSFANIFIRIYFVYSQKRIIFAACLRINARPKIVKKAENNEFLQLKNMNDTEIKEWQTQSVKHKVAMVLIMDGVSFSYTEEDGIVFTAPECYVARLIRRLMSCYGCSVRPKFKEFV